MPWLFNVTKPVALLAVAFSGLTSLSALADGGISLGVTRIIYPQNSRQESLSINNSSSTASFLVQSWVENAQGQKSSDFVATPPLYVSGPKNENVLRLMKVRADLPGDRESLYYFVAKAIPAMDDKDKTSGGNVLRIAAAMRIKLFVRPAGLTPAVDKAPSALSFHLAGGQLEINNPTPYYITLINMRVSNKHVEDTMVAPKNTTRVSLPAAGSSITFSTINDYGGVSTPISVGIN